MKTITKQFTALLLVAAMCMSLLCTNVWATEIEKQEVSEPQKSEESWETSSPIEEIKKETESDESMSGTKVSEEAVSPEPEPKEAESSSDSYSDGATDTKQRETKKHQTSKDADHENVLTPLYATNGNYGTNIYYEYDYDTKTLTISGNGEMEASYNYPWENYRDCTRLIIQDGITSIGDCAFAEFYNITDISFPASVKTIGTGAFTKCDSLKKVIIPSNVETIGRDAFSYCQKLAILSMQSGLVSIGDDAFAVCDSLREVIIPDTVTTIGSGAFTSCSVLERVKLPSGLREISKNMFAGDSKLTAPILPKSLETIGAYSFDDCERIKKLLLPSSISEIGEGAFSGSGITKMVFPASVTVINESVFDYCPVETIVFEGAPPTMWSSSLDVYTGYDYTPPVDVYFPEIYADRWTKATRESLDGDLTWYPYCHIENDEIVTAHSMGQGTVTKEPTYEHTGIKTYTCAQCGFTNTETIPKLVKPVPVMSQKDAEKLYGPVLDMFYYNTKTGWKYYPDISTGLSSVSYLYPRYWTSKSDCKLFSYCFKDINSDGTPELIISSGGAKNQTSIDELYTCVNGQLYHLLSSGERYQHYLLSDGTLLEESSGGAYCAYYDHYQLKKNAKSFTFLEGVIDTGEYDDNGKFYPEYYHVTKAKWDNYGRWTESSSDSITKKQLNAIMNAWPKTIKYNATLFSKYSPRSKSAVYVAVSASVPKTTLKSAKAGKAGSAAVTWKKNSKGKGYWVQCSTDKAFLKNVKTVKIKSNGTTKTTVKGLKKGTWYIRICTVKGNSYSSWSGSKKVKVK